MIDPRQPDYTRTPAHPGRARFGYAPRGPVASGSTPAVTIMTPYYNTGPVFHETAASVFAQSFQDWEWIIVNDGSTDAGALAVLDEYRRRDPRVRVLDLPGNRGLSAARNAGYSAARADVVMQIDSDDMAEPTFLEKCLWFLRCNPQWGFVCGWTVGFGADEYLWARGFHNLERFLEENLVTPTSLVRTRVWRDAGGYDESNRKGLEDWDFWLRCAAAGHWGTCIPEFLDWYRRRPNHNSSWGNWDRGPNQARFSAELRTKYASLYTTGLPRPRPVWPTALAPLPPEPQVSNPLAKDGPRLLMIVPWLRFGGADKFNLDLIEQLTRRGWKVTVAATLEGDQSWLSQYDRLTPDVFVLERFLRPADRVMFLRSLIESRRPDAVMVTNSELGYHVLPYLRSCCPEPAYVDLCHIEEENWKSGGYPRYGAASQDLLELNIVVSEHLRRWMIDRGADGDRVEVCHINVDPGAWRPDHAARRATRERLGIDPDVPVLIYPARLCPQKQPRVMAETLRRLAADPTAPGFVALVVGDGEDRPWLEAFIAEHGLNERIRLLGPQDPTQMPDLFRASDILFLPSRWEGIALSIYEAMAAGLAVVGSDVGGQRELVTPETGLLLPVADLDPDAQADRYAAALAPLLGDAERRGAMGRAARARIEAAFTLDAMGDRMICLLEMARRRRAEHPRPAVPRRLAEEIAVRAVDYFRLQRACERIAREQTSADQAPARPKPARPPKKPKQDGRSRRGGRRGGPHGRAGGSRRRAAASLAELKMIESSRSWRAIEGIRRSFPYAIYARLRFGPRWRDASAAARALPPAKRLELLKSSGAYRMLVSVKSSALYRTLRRPGTRVAAR